MSSLVSWSLRHPDLTNLFVAVLILLIGSIFYVRQPQVFRAHNCARRAFDVWIALWVTFAALYILMAFLRPTEEGALTQSSLVLVLLFVELTTFFAGAFSWMLFQGDNCSAQKVLGWLGFLLALLLLWDIGFGLLGATTLARRVWWVFPSRVLSLLGLLSMGVILVVRNRVAAVPFLVVAIVYATAQFPVYVATFVTQERLPDWFSALGVGKLLLGLTFYPAFFSPARNYNPLSVAPLLAGRGKLTTILIRIALWVSGILVGVFADLLRQWLLKLLGLAK